jgi:hypothetical protein
MPTDTPLTLAQMRQLPDVDEGARGGAPMRTYTPALLFALAAAVVAAGVMLGVWEMGVGV